MNLTEGVRGFVSEYNAVSYMPKLPRGGTMPPEIETRQSGQWRWNPTTVWVFVGIITIGFWVLEGQWSLWRSVLIVGLGFASFTTGCLAGFLFTSYGEETATV